MQVKNDCKKIKNDFKRASRCRLKKKQEKE